MAQFEKSQKNVGISEGGYQNDPKDTGNWYMGKLIGTNWGISAPTLGGYLGRIPTAQEMKTLAKATAVAILKTNYWTANNFDRLKNQSVATMLYDGVVNHGNSAMRKLVERVLSRFRKSLASYKVFTKEGIDILNTLNQKELFSALKNARKTKYESLNNSRYLKGWLNRLERIHFEEVKKTSDPFLYSALLIVGIGMVLIGL
jgi:lysozyme family protein